jgi:DMSO/TMAO reductase YedYZ heme-binding membrane subunit
MPAQALPTGSRLLGLLSLALLVLNMLALASGDSFLDGVHAQIRLSARTSLLLFLTAYSAAGLLRLWPGPITRWIMKQRRWIGLSFAVSHALHLLGILALVRFEPGFERDAVTLIGGGLAYVLIALMATTSNDAAVRLLGARNWRRLHLAGLHYLWILFFNSYAPRAATGSPGYVLLALALLAALGLRIAAWRRRRTASA